jgi:CdiI immunity protein
MPALAHLMGASFHQDWMMDGGSIDDTVEAFLQEPADLACAAVADIDLVLARDYAEGGLTAELVAMGCGYFAGEHDSDCRAWLTVLRDRISSSPPRKADPDCMRAQLRWTP